MSSMIHCKASTLQLHKVKGRERFKVFTGLSVSRKGSKALRLQEAKCGVPQFHDTGVSHSKPAKPWNLGTLEPAVGLQSWVN